MVVDLLSTDTLTRQELVGLVQAIGLDPDTTLSVTITADAVTAECFIPGTGAHTLHWTVAE